MEYENMNQHLDDPQSSIQHGELIRSKIFLNKLYREWYHYLIRRIEHLPEGKIVELGSGGGFIKELLPDVITSDVMPLPGNDMTFSAEEMPFDDNSLASIFMIDVLHHIPDCRAFFSEAQRVLQPGGMIIMSEPANTLWSRFFYKNFHHEPFDPKSGWEIENSTGPLSGANGAIPWIVFNRDIELFHQEFSQLSLVNLELHTPLRYLISGGLSYRSLLPHQLFGMLTKLEKLFTPIYAWTAMFQLIEVAKHK
jgi:SAM-dependent methyltransferase